MFWLVAVFCVTGGDESVIGAEDTDRGKLPHGTPGCAIAQAEHSAGDRPVEDDTGGVDIVIGKF